MLTGSRGFLHLFTVLYYNVKISGVTRNSIQNVSNHNVIPLQMQLLKELVPREWGFVISFAPYAFHVPHTECIF